MIALWDITKECNISCTHCYNKERYNNSIRKSIDSEYIKVIDEIKRNGFERIHFLGGEPLMSHYLLDSIEYATKQGLDTSMVSNGLLLNEVTISKLLKTNLSSISISIEGVNSETHDHIRGIGSFDKTIENVKKMISMRNLMNKNLSIGLSYTLTKQNIEQSNELIEFASSLGVDSVAISKLSNEGAASENWNDIYLSEMESLKAMEDITVGKFNYPNVHLILDCKKLFKEYLYKKYSMELASKFESKCRGGKEQYYITAFGDVLPCSPSGTSMGEKTMSKIEGTIKNILVDVDSFKSKRINDFNHFSVTRGSKNESCRRCKYNDVCSPCPLLVDNYNLNSIAECEEANRLLKLLKSNDMKKKISISKGITSVIDGDITILTNGDYELEINTEDYQLLNEINNAYTLQDFKSNIESKNINYNDYIEYIYDLKYYGIVEFS